MALKNGPNLGALVNGAAGEAHYAELMRQWRTLDALVQPSVIGRVATVPTTELVDGDRYLVTSGANANKIARYSTDLTVAGWEYYTPKDGWVVWSTDDGQEFRFMGASWVADSGGGGGGGGPAGVLQVTGTSRVLGIGDATRYLRFTNGSAVTVTVPPESSVTWDANTEIHIRRAADGPLTLTAGSGVTLIEPSGGTLILGDRMTVTLKRVAEDVWDVIGQTVAL